MIGLYLPPLPPNQATFIERRVVVTKHTISMEDGVYSFESRLVYPEIPNPYYAF